MKPQGEGMQFPPAAFFFYSKDRDKIVQFIVE